MTRCLSYYQTSNPSPKPRILPRRRPSPYTGPAEPSAAKPDPRPCIHRAILTRQSPRQIFLFHPSPSPPVTTSAWDLFTQMTWTLLLRLRTYAIPHPRLHPSSDLTHAAHIIPSRYHGAGSVSFLVVMPSLVSHWPYAQRCLTSLPRPEGNNVLPEHTNCTYV